MLDNMMSGLNLLNKPPLEMRVLAQVGITIRSKGMFRLLFRSIAQKFLEDAQSAMFSTVPGSYLHCRGIAYRE